MVVDGHLQDQCIVGLLLVMMAQGMHDPQQIILTSQVQELEDLLELHSSKMTLEGLGSITSVLPHLSVCVLCQLPGLLCGVLGGQVCPKLFHASMECHT